MVLGPDSVRERVLRLGGLCDVLVHGYFRVDPERVAEYLRRVPRDFSDVALAIPSWLDRTHGS